MCRARRARAGWTSTPPKSAMWNLYNLEIE
jgi:hypothetical protein